MQYIEVIFDYDFEQDYLLDLFVQGLGDLGFESFTDDVAYIPASLFNEQALRTYADEFGQKIRAISTIADQNWNAAWEAEHPVQELPLGIRITPHCAFGAGYHETTSMMTDALLTRNLSGQTVLDMGCGTGVLAIFAAKLGARRVVAVDIDDKSVVNAQENAAANNVTLDIRLGSTPPDEPFDLILANIHRNVLIAQMPDYARILNESGELWLSGFYEADIEPLIHEAAKYGLTLAAKQERGEWRWLAFQKTAKQ